MRPSAAICLATVLGGCVGWRGGNIPRTPVAEVKPIAGPRIPVVVHENTPMGSDPGLAEFLYRSYGNAQRSGQSLFDYNQAVLEHEKNLKAREAVLKPLLEKGAPIEITSWAEFTEELKIPLRAFASLGASQAASGTDGPPATWQQVARARWRERAARGEPAPSHARRYLLTLTTRPISEKRLWLTVLCGITLTAIPAMATTGLDVKAELYALEGGDWRAIASTQAFQKQNTLIGILMILGMPFAWPDFSDMDPAVFGHVGRWAHQQITTHEAGRAQPSRGGAGTPLKPADAFDG